MPKGGFDYPEERFDPGHYDDDRLYASWIGSDGKKYGTTDPEVVRRQINAGHTNWVVAPPASMRAATE